MAVEQVPILDFMLVRPPSEMDKEVARRRYIGDTVLTKAAHGHADVDLQSESSPSAIGRLIYQKAFEQRNPNDVEAMQEIRNGVLSLLIAREPSAVNIAELERRAYLRSGDTFYLLPDRLDYVPAALSRPLAKLLPILLKAAQPQPVPAMPAAAGTPTWAEKLADQVRPVFDGQALAAVVFDGSGYSDAFETSKRALFDALYILYVLRRWTTVNFEHIMEGLQALHVLEALAVDELYIMGRAGRLKPDGNSTIASLTGDFPQFKGWTGTSALPGLPLIGSAAVLAEYLDARPIVHPIFAQLTRYARPFNTIKPLGVGDLKVVKQWLIGYEAGEISDIHNVMLGESKERVHRRLEKTEDAFSSSSSSSSETSHDTASTDRFEVKREAENVVKTDLSVNANLRAQYQYGTVVLVAVGAGFAYNRNTSDQQKLAQNFSREVVDKAVSRVQSSTTTNRSVTKLFETEEINKHGFVNAPGTSHVSGIYRWVDKRYKAQVFNYGKRMMFEFVLPEPAAFLVESRLRAFEASLDYPEKPKVPDYKSVEVGFEPADITPARFQSLLQTYDLGDETYPPEYKTVEFFNQEANGAMFAEAGLNLQNVWHSKSFTLRLGSAGYLIEKLRITGLAQFVDRSDPILGEMDRNIASMRIDGTTVWYEEHSNLMFNTFADDYEVPTANGPYLLTRDDVNMTLAFQELDRYDLMISATMRRGDDLLLKWQTGIWNKVAAMKAKEVNAINQELKIGYDSRMATFRNRIDDLKSTAIHDLLQGQSEAYNRDLIMSELRRQCLAMLTKEFDADTEGDVLTDWDAMGTRQFKVKYRKIAVDDTKDPIVVEWGTSDHDIKYPVPDLTEARGKGRYIQFLEQAFEWSRLGYTCYPYFWAAPPKWIDLMNRTDDADPNLTAFLRAGAAKVLVAVTPAYDDAVLHFLATREPWEGGPAPVIGDPLYLPIFEELHRQQDDRYGAVPDGEPWTFTLPTSLVYLHGSSTPLPTVPPITP